VSDPAVILDRAHQRLSDLAELSRNYGVRIVLLVPPTLHEDHSKEIQQIGEEAGLPVWVPSPPGEFPREYFRDGFHLNTIGSGIFTSRLAQRIRTLQNLQANCNSCRLVQSAK
jgi:lysophospholipase L1-like esterase